MFPFSLLFAGVGGSVILTGETGFQSDPGNICHNGFRFQDDGSIDEIGPSLATLVQIDPGEWWSSEPDIGIGANYEIRALSAGKTGTWDVSGAADDVWVLLSASPTWRVFVTGASSPNNKSASATFEIRVASSGSAIASATFLAEADN